MRCIRIPFLLSALALLLFPAAGAAAQDQWPCTIRSGQTTIVVYQPQPQSLSGDKLTAIAAVSVTQQGKEPVYGVVWLDAAIHTDRSTHSVVLDGLKVPDARFPGSADSAGVARLRALLERELPKHAFELSMDQLVTSLDQQATSANGLKNDPPEIIFREMPSLLVLTDGQPKLEKDAALGLQRVVNSPFTILHDAGKYYLFVGGRWFAAPAATGAYTYTGSIPAGIKKAQQQTRDGGFAGARASLRASRWTRCRRSL
ncbi:hypothetical protein [uncultured Chitinophaga sp.]|uniref:hypothetical protein n=2 Tax=Chitinophaga TaxID=79328 RepID=UPI0026321814|nr:hypothetical protein [uncultured Chitinophaga sp.]